MCDPFQLLANCPIDPRMIVPVNICPDRGVPVDVFSTTAVAQERAVPLDNHDWFMLRRAPFRHVSKGVPNKLFVRGNQFFSVPIAHAFLKAIPKTTAAGKLLRAVVVTQPSWLWGQRASCPFLPRFGRARCPFAPQAGSLCYRLAKPHPSLNFPNHFSQRQ